jgi:hypothetical protein
MRKSLCPLWNPIPTSPRFLSETTNDYGWGFDFQRALLLIALFCGSDAAQPALLRVSLQLPALQVRVRAELSSEGQAWLGATISRGSFSDLRWPNFSDYSKYVKKFYEFNGDSLWWVKGMEPTAQARQVIALFLKADQKGLSAEDYDGSRWNDRLARLKPATRQPTEADAVKFDLALTVCAMRYISDLHIGKVYPNYLAFALMMNPRDTIWPNFSKTTLSVRATLPASWRKWSRPIPVTGVRFKPCKRISSLRGEMMGSSSLP